MSDTAIIGENVEVIEANMASSTPFSWSAAIAGAFAAMAVAFLVVSLGSGIGLSLASPYGWGPSATTLTIAGAIWLLMAHAFAFATGGYLAGRLRSPAYDGLIDETRFRDGAQGFLVWALGVVAMATIVALAALFTAGAATQVTSAAAVGTGAAMSNPQNTTSVTDTTGYFVDALFRPNLTATANQSAPNPNAPAGATIGAAPSGATALGGAPAAQPLNAETRSEVARIVARGISQGELVDNDRTYLAQLVAQRTGMPPDEAQRRVTEVENRAKETVKEAADKAAKAGAYFSFWTFMALLFGAAAATLGGIAGGELRDGDSFGRRARA